MFDLLEHKYQDRWLQERRKAELTKRERHQQKVSLWSRVLYTVEPRYNEVLGTVKITLLYQVSHYIGVKKLRNIKSWDQQNYLVIRGFCYRHRFHEVMAQRALMPSLRENGNVISDLFITRFHCTMPSLNSYHWTQLLGKSTLALGTA